MPPLWLPPPERSPSETSDATDSDDSEFRVTDIGLATSSSEDSSDSDNDDVLYELEVGGEADGTENNEENNDDEEHVEEEEEDNEDDEDNDEDEDNEEDDEDNEDTEENGEVTSSGSEENGNAVSNANSSGPSWQHPEAPLRRSARLAAQYTGQSLTRGGHRDNEEHQQCTTHSNTTEHVSISGGYGRHISDGNSRSGYSSPVARPQSADIVGVEGTGTTIQPSSPAPYITSDSIDTVMQSNLIPTVTFNTLSPQISRNGSQTEENIFRNSNSLAIGSCVSSTLAQDVRSPYRTDRDNSTTVNAMSTGMAQHESGSNIQQDERSVTQRNNVHDILTCQPVGQNYVSDHINAWLCSLLGQVRQCASTGQTVPLSTHVTDNGGASTQAPQSDANPLLVAAAALVNLANRNSDISRMTQVGQPPASVGHCPPIPLNSPIKQIPVTSPQLTPSNRLIDQSQINYQIIPSSKELSQPQDGLCVSCYGQPICSNVCIRSEAQCFTSMEEQEYTSGLQTEFQPVQFYQPNTGHANSVLYNEPTDVVANHGSVMSNLYQETGAQYSTPTCNMPALRTTIHGSLVPNTVTATSCIVHDRLSSSRLPVGNDHADNAACESIFEPVVFTSRMGPFVPIRPEAARLEPSHISSSYDSTESYITITSLCKQLNVLEKSQEEVVKENDCLRTRVKDLESKVSWCNLARENAALLQRLKDLECNLYHRLTDDAEPSTSKQMPTVRGQKRKNESATTPSKRQKNQSGATASKKQSMEKVTATSTKRHKGESVELERKKIGHSSHLNEPGIVLTLGEGDTGQLGHGEDILERKRPFKVSALPENIVQTCAGGMHTLCITNNGEVYSFGCNDEGALGRDTSEEGSEMSPAKVRLDAHIVQICAGDSHSASLTDDGHVFAWGTFRDANGSIGLTADGLFHIPVAILADKTIVKIASGCDHLVCLTADGEVYTAGCADQGQLGRVAECFSNRGGRRGLDRLLAPGLVRCKRAGSRKRAFFSDIWTGTYCTFSLERETGEVYGWGLNNYYQLGFADMKNRFQPEKVRSFSGKKWLSISGGQHHTIALDDNGHVFSLGRAEYGRLGLGEGSGEKTEPSPVASLNGHKCVQVAAGNVVSLTVTDDGEVYAWGMGTNKQLGTGDEDDVWVPTKMAGKALENMNGIQVSAGGQHTVILARDMNASSS